MNKRLVCGVMPIVLVFFSACGEVQEDFNNKKSYHTMPTDNLRFIESETYVVITDSSRTTHTTTVTDTVKPESKKEDETTNKPVSTSAMATEVVVTAEPIPTTIVNTTTKFTETATMGVYTPRGNESKTETVDNLIPPNLEDCYIPDNLQDDEEELPNPTMPAWEVTHESILDDIIFNNSQSPTASAESEMIVNTIPKSVLVAIEEQQKKYPHMQVALGFFALDGSRCYVYNGDLSLFGACTIKAPYACFVLKEAERRGINISEYKIEYNPATDKLGGSGDIYKNSKKYYTVEELLQKLIYISDNTAYRMLDKEFSVDDFKVELEKIGGATEFKNRYFSYATVYERYNEWKWIYEYEQTGSEYAQCLEALLKNAQAYYFGIGTYSQHQHKSGWTENDAGNMYTACDAGIVSDKYILVILTRDDFAEAPNADPVRAIGRSVNNFVVKNDIF